jgi:hypothetical protein
VSIFSPRLVLCAAAKIGPCCTSKRLPMALLQEFLEQWRRYNVPRSTNNVTGSCSGRTHGWQGPSISDCGEALVLGAHPCLTL